MDKQQLTVDGDNQKLVVSNEHAKDICVESKERKCPVCGPVMGYVDITIQEFEGKYCLVCYARWISKTFPRLEDL